MRSRGQATDPSPARNTFIAIAAVVLLLIVVPGIYRMRYPVYYWNVECVVRDGTGKVLSSRTIQRLATQHQVEDFVTWAEKRGETCAVIPVRQWYTFARLHAP